MARRYPRILGDGSAIVNRNLTLRNAARHLAVNALLAVCYAVILLGPIVFWIMTP